MPSLVPTVPLSLTLEKLDEARKLIDGGMPVRAVAKIVGSSQAMLYRVLGPKKSDLNRSLKKTARANITKN